MSRKQWEDGGAGWRMGTSWRLFCIAWDYGDACAINAFVFGIIDMKYGDRDHVTHSHTLFP